MTIKQPEENIFNRRIQDCHLTTQRDIDGINFDPIRQVGGLKWEKMHRGWFMKRAKNWQDRYSVCGTFKLELEIIAPHTKEDRYHWGIWAKVHYTDHPMEGRMPDPNGTHWEWLDIGHMRLVGDAKNEIKLLLETNGVCH